MESRTRYVVGRGVWSAPRRLAVVSLVLVLAAALSACGSDDDESADDQAASDQSQPVVIDTDMSVEGAMAILYLLRAPEMQVEAITISGTGLVSCDRGVEQALGLVELAGGGDVPVACGPTQPIEGSNRFPPSFRAAADSLSGVAFSPSAEPSDLGAPELLASVIGDSDEPVIVYADGPLTNVATAFELDDAVVDNVAEIYLMGGALDVAGNVEVNPDAEWNIWIDPVAADEVLQAGAPVTIVPLDATNEVPLTPLHVAALEEYQQDQVAETVYTLVRNAGGVSEGFAYFWDQLNANVIIDPTVVTLEDRTVAVVIDDDLSAAGVLRDESDGTTVRVAVDADREAFEASFLSILLGEPFEPVDLSPDLRVSFDGTEWSSDGADAYPLGPFVLAADNQSSQDAVVALGWLTGDATLSDLEDWGSVEQPPFLEVAGFAYIPPGGDALSVIELTEPGEHTVSGLVFAPDESTLVGTFRVDDT